jgi:hypothetical protein
MGAPCGALRGAGTAVGATTRGRPDSNHLSRLGTVVRSCLACDMGKRAPPAAKIRYSFRQNWVPTPMWAPTAHPRLSRSEGCHVANPCRRFAEGHASARPGNVRQPESPDRLVGAQPSERRREPDGMVGRDTLDKFAEEITKRNRRHTPISKSASLEVVPRGCRCRPGMLICKRSTVAPGPEWPRTRWVGFLPRHRNCITPPG